MGSFGMLWWMGRSRVTRRALLSCRNSLSRLCSGGRDERLFFGRFLLSSQAIAPKRIHRPPSFFRQIDRAPQEAPFHRFWTKSVEPVGRKTFCENNFWHSQKMGRAGTNFVPGQFFFVKVWFLAFRPFTATWLLWEEGKKEKPVPPGIPLTLFSLTTLKWGSPLPFWQSDLLQALPLTWLIEPCFWTWFMTWWKPCLLNA